MWYLQGHTAERMLYAIKHCPLLNHTVPDSKVHGANMGPTWADRTHVGPMLAPWTLLSMVPLHGSAQMLLVLYQESSVHISLFLKGLYSKDLELFKMYVYYNFLHNHVLCSECYNALTPTCLYYTFSDNHGDVIMGAIASQTTILTIVYSTVYSEADHRKHQSSASLAFVWGIHRDLWIPRTNGQVTRKMFPFDDVIIYSRNPLWTSAFSQTFYL